MDLGLKEIIAPLRKWWWLILLATTIAGAASYLATQQQPVIYKSTATLMIGNAIEELNPTSSDFVTSRQLARTYVDLANRASVRNATREALGLTWLPDIFVRQLNDTNIIDVIVADTDPLRAQAVAAELSRQIAMRSPGAQNEDQERLDFINKQLTDYQKAITELQEEITEKRDALGELTSARQIAAVQSEISGLEGNLQELQANYATLLQSTEQGATNSINIIEPASPAWPERPSNLIAILTAAGMGFVLATSAAYVLEYLDDTIKTAATIRRLTGLYTLVAIAEISNPQEQLITRARPRSPISEAFRILRTGIQFSTVDSEDQTLVITSSVPQEGKSTVTANLAVVMAQAGHNVLLMDADLRRPSQQRVFDMPNNRGVTSLLLELEDVNSDEEVKAVLDRMVQQTPVQGLQLLTSGPIPPNPSELLGSTKMKTLLKKLATFYDYLIIDSPPVLAVTDANILSAEVDSTLLVVRANKSRRGQVKQSVERLREGLEKGKKDKIIGCVLNAISPKSEGYSSYYYYRDPYYVYGDEDSEKEVAPTPEGTIGSRSGKLRERMRGQTKGAITG